MSAELPDELLGMEDVAPGQQETDERREEQGEEEERVRYMLFELGETTYGLHVNDVRTIVEPREYTRVPRSSEAVEGLLDLRGDITAVIDPRVHFDTATPAPDRAEQRIVVFDRGADEQSAAVIVDEVLGVEDFPESRIRQHATSGPAEHPMVGTVLERVGDDGETVEAEIGVVSVPRIIDASRRQTA